MENKEKEEIQAGLIKSYELLEEKLHRINKKITEIESKLQQER